MDAAWDEYRRRRREFWMTVCVWPLLLVPLGLIEDFLAGHGYGRSSLVTFFVVVVPPLACVAIAHLRVMNWRCPNCGRRFHVCWWYGNAFARRCVHCGLPKWTAKPKPVEADLV